MKFGTSRIRLKDLNPDSDLHIFIGPNGSGKSMSLRELEEEINKKYNDGCNIYNGRISFVGLFGDDPKITKPVITYKTHNDDVMKNTMDFDPYRMMSAFRSEGERMDDSLYFWYQDVFIKLINKYKPTEYYLLLDELDSGLSFDRISLQLMQLRGIIDLEIKRGAKVHTIITANSYELLEVAQKLFDKTSIYWVPTKKQIEVDSYIKFRELYKSRYKTLLKEIEEDN